MISIGIVALSLLSGCNLHYVRGTGEVVKENRPANSAFHKVSFGSGIDGDVKRGPASIVVEADKAAVPYIVTRIRGDELIIETAEHSAINTDADLIVHVTTPEFDVLEVSGGGRVSAEPGKVEKLVVESSGGAKVKLTGVQAQELELSSSGGGELSVQGTAQQVRADVSGGGSLKATELPVTKLTLDASGGSDVEAAVSDEISGELSGGSKVKLKGRPALKGFEVSGGSEITTE